LVKAGCLGALASDLVRAQLDDEKLGTLYRELEHPLVPVLAAIETNGIRVDTDALAGQSQRMDAELADLQTRVFTLAGEEFNINSPRQLSAILFDKLALPSRKKSGIKHKVCLSVH
jgi:DNA polymerase-1